MATAGRRVSESESSEGSSSSDDSLLTDTSQLSLQPYMHEPPATSSTYRRKVDQSASQHTISMGLAIADSLNSDSVDERHQQWFVTFHFVHTSFLMFHKPVHA